jgi:nucleoside-diphosphate-sugar epimerase
MKAKTISILGCGWLGLPLAEHCLACGFHVKGSTTTPSKIPILKDKGIEPYLVSSEGSLDSRFFASEILFLNIPFRKDFKDPQIYSNQIDALLNVVSNAPISFLIFASSTSIYPDHIGEAREDISFIPDNPRSEVLLNIEKKLFSSQSFQSTILRFAGLYGPNRMIGQFLAGKSNLSLANAPVNLVHQRDCVEIIFRVIEKNIRGEIFNVCSDEHPLRKELYTKAAQKMNLPVPQFKDETGISSKIVSNQKIKNRLRYQFLYPDPLKII